MARLTALILLALLAAGCVAPANDPTPPANATPPATTPAEPCQPHQPQTSNSGVSTGNGPTVSDQPGSFSYSGQSTLRDGVKEGYRWSDPSPSASFSWSGAPTAGTLQVQVFDACGKKLYDHSFGQGSSTVSEQLPAGTAGSWTIQLTFTQFSGSATFSLTG